MYGIKDFRDHTHRKRFITRMERKHEDRVKEHGDEMQYYDGFHRELRIKPYERVQYLDT